MTSQGYPLPTKLLLFKQVKTLKYNFEVLKKLLTITAVAEREEKNNPLSSMIHFVLLKTTGPKWSCLC